MSEVHRYKAVKMLSEAGNTISYTPHGPDVVLASQHDAALAALREELARIKGISDNYYSLLVDANQSLAAAEQRNAALLELLRDIYNQNELSGFDEQRILEAIQPTESGASE